MREFEILKKFNLSAKFRPNELKKPSIKYLIDGGAGRFFKKFFRELFFNFVKKPLNSAFQI